MMKYIFYYNENNEYIGFDKLEVDAEIPSNATTVEPVDENGVGLYDPDGTVLSNVGKAFPRVNG